MGGPRAASTRLAQRRLRALHLDLRVRCPSAVAAAALVSPCGGRVAAFLGGMGSFFFGGREGFFGAAEGGVLVQASDVGELAAAVGAHVGGRLGAALQVGLLPGRLVLLQDGFLHQLVLPLQRVQLELAGGHLAELHAEVQPLGLPHAPEGIFARVVQHDHAVLGLHGLFQGHGVLLRGVPLPVTRGGTGQDVLVQLGHVVDAFATLGAADGRGERLRDVVRGEVGGRHADAHGVAVVVLEGRRLEAGVVLVEAQPHVGVLCLDPGGHDLYGGVQLLRGIVQLLLLLLLGGGRGLLGQAPHVLRVGLAGVREVVRPQGPTCKLVVRAHLIRVQVPLVLLQIAQERKLLFTNGAHKDIPNSMEQEAVLGQIRFILKKLHTEFTFEGPLFSMDR